MSNIQPNSTTDSRLETNRIAFADRSYAIVISVEADELIRSLANRIVWYIREQTGIETEIRSDADVPANYEIVIGKTCRHESIRMKNTLSENEWIVSVQPSGCIYVLGSDIYGTVHAVDQLMASAITVENGKLTIPADLCLRGTLILSDFEKKGAIPAHVVRSSQVKDAKGHALQSNLKFIRHIQPITQLAGEYSINRTRSRFGVPVADLGVTCVHKGKIHIFFGDTYDGYEGTMGNIVSNVCAYTSDADYLAGVRLDGYLADENGKAIPITMGQFEKNVLENVTTGHEYTRIPTGAISLNGAIYMSFMSVAVWLSDDRWRCHFGGIMKSDDDGKTWIQLDTHWPGDSRFCQMAPAYNPADDHVYVTGIGAGRQGPARIMRVKAADYECFDAYEYLTGYELNGNPIWTKGEAGLYSTFAVTAHGTWEPCFFYNEYLEEWLITHKDEHGCHFYTAKNPWGPFEHTAEIYYPHYVSGHYALFMHPVFSRNGGKNMAMFMSTMYGIDNCPNFWQVMVWDICFDREVESE